MHAPIVSRNREDHCTLELFNSTTMNAVSAAHATSDIRWEYWHWALANAADEYHQLPHYVTG